MSIINNYNFDLLSERVNFHSGLDVLSDDISRLIDKKLDVELNTNISSIMDCICYNLENYESLFEKICYNFLTTHIVTNITEFRAVIRKKGNIANELLSDLTSDKYNVFDICSSTHKERVKKSLGNIYTISLNVFELEKEIKNSPHIYNESWENYCNYITPFSESCCLYNIEHIIPQLNPEDGSKIQQSILDKYFDSDLLTFEIQGEDNLAKNTYHCEDTNEVHLFLEGRTYLKFLKKKLGNDLEWLLLKENTEIEVVKDFIRFSFEYCKKAYPDFENGIIASILLYWLEKNNIYVVPAFSNKKKGTISSLHLFIIKTIKEVNIPAYKTCQSHLLTIKEIINGTNDNDTKKLRLSSIIEQFNNFAKYYKIQIA